MRTEEGRLSQNESLYFYKERMKSYLIFGLLILALVACVPTQEKVSPPNIIYILADDLGYGDISSFNPDSKIETPHIDALAEGGMRFIDAHSGSAVCTPTRYGILTGRYSWRTRLKKGVLWSYDPHLIPEDRLTVAKLLKRNGYHTAAIGKWHLGVDFVKDEEGFVDYTQPISHGPLSNGFDEFFGITASLDIPPYVYIEDNDIIHSRIDTVEANEGLGFWRKGPVGDGFTHVGVLPRLKEEALSYINSQASTDKPFFLYFPLPAPHTPVLPIEAYEGKSSTTAYGDFVLMIDDLVGEIIATLEKNGQADNTLIIFTSDNGFAPYADTEGLESIGHFPSYQFRGYKADIYEGGHRIPFIARWPGVIPKNTSSDQTICLIDFMATVAAIQGDSLQDNQGEDSYDLLPVLKGNSQGDPVREATVHHSVNGSFAIRQGKWKLIFCPGSGGWSAPTPKVAREQDLPIVQLYDLEVDIGEQTNLAETNPEIVEELTTLMKKYIEEGRSTPGPAQENEGETELFISL
ncbi:MAG: arylsulfatase [Bacteroidota bacterium]